MKLIVVDSLAALFRCEFESGEMFSRAKQLQRFGGRLHALSLKHNIPVVCVNQVRTITDFIILCIYSEDPISENALSNTL